MRKTIIFLMLLAMLLLPGIEAADAASAYYQMISYNATDVSEYQQDLVIHRTTGTAYEETSGGLKIWHLYVGDHCQEDYGDLRFSDGYGRELAYYLWPDFDTNSARFCVRLEGADAAGVLQVWYGNPSAATTSDGDVTFLFFDHFDGVSFDPEKWTIAKGNRFSVAGSVLTVSGYNAYQTLVTKQTFPIRTRTEWLAQFNSFSRGDTEYVGYGQGGQGFTVFPPSFNKNKNSLSATVVGWGNPTSSQYAALGTQYAGDYHRYEVERTSESATKFYIDDVLVASLGESGSTGSNPLAVNAWVNGLTVKVDYVIVRAYSATPPSATAFSGERASLVASAFTATPTSGTAPLTVQFTDTSLGNVTAWSWAFGDGDASSSQHPSHTYTSPGTYTVSLTVANDAGEDTETKSGYITVADSPAFSVSASPRSGAAPLTVAFSALQTSTTPITSWAWTFGDGNTSTEHNPVHNYTETGTYTVTVTGSHAYGSTQVVRTAYIQVRTDVIIQPNINETRIQSAVNNYDPMNGKYTRYWSNMSGGFPVYGFVFSIVAPFVEFFGYWFFVILWFVYLGCAYLRTGTTTIPLVVGLISGSVWGAIMPPESHLIAYVLLAIAAVGLLMKIYVRDRL